MTLPRTGFERTQKRRSPLTEVLGHLPLSDEHRLEQDIRRDEQRLRNLGATLPQPPQRRNLLITALDIIDRPGAAVRGAVHALATPEKEPVLGTALQALQGRKRIGGEDVLEALNIAPENRLARAIAGVTVEIGLDPLTYMTLGLAPGIKRTAKAGMRHAMQPKHAIHLGTIMGYTHPLARIDITRPVEAIKRGAQWGMGKPGRFVQDKLGQAFIRDYIPTAFKGKERKALTEGRRLVTELERRAATVGRLGLYDTLEDWKKRLRGQNPTEQDHAMATYLFRERATPAGQAMRDLHIQYGLLQKEAADLTRKLERMATHNPLYDRTRVRFDHVTQNLERIKTRLPSAAEAVKKKRASFLESIGQTEFSPLARQIARHGMDIVNRRTKELKELGIEQEIIDNIYKQATATGRKKAGGRTRPGETYVTVTSSVYDALANQVVATHRMAESMKALGDNVIKPSGKRTRGAVDDQDDWITINAREMPLLAGHKVHPELHDSLRRIYEIHTAPDQAIKDLNKAWRFSMDTFKNISTAWMPRFHLVNAMGNFFLNVVDGVDPRTYYDAVKALLGRGEIELLPGRFVPATQLKREFRRQALEGQGLFSIGAPQHALREQAQLAAGRLKIGPRETIDYARSVYEAPRDLGSLTDSYFRMANFIHHLRRGMPPTKAATRTRTALFDYGALTPFERQAANVLLPFYAWTRFNMPAMLDLLVRRPAVISATARVSDIGARVHEVKPEERPLWLRDTQAMVIGRDAEGRPQFFNPMLPFTDLSRIVFPTGGQWRHSLREAWGMVAPHYKIIPELLLNRQFFMDRPVMPAPDIPGGALSHVLEYFGRQIAPFREAMLLQDMLMEEPSKQDKRVTRRLPFMGGLLTTIDPENLTLQQRRQYHNLIRQVIASYEDRGITVPFLPRQ